MPQEQRRLGELKLQHERRAVWTRHDVDPGVEQRLADRFADVCNAATIASRSSEIVMWARTGMPISANSRLSHWLLVSSFAPVVNSVPTEMISACIGFT